jgi:hypothetical protein
MNSIELRAALERFEKQYPGRELNIEARDRLLRIRIAFGTLQPLSSQDSSLGRGSGSRWEKIEILDEGEDTFEERVRKILSPANLELWDFGEDTVAMPLARDGGWLASLCSYVVRREVKPRFLGFAFTPDFKLAAKTHGDSSRAVQDEILRRLPEARDRFDELSLPISPEGGVLPSPRLT